MKALVYDGPEKLNYRDMPDPVPTPGQALVLLESVGICGSDMHAYHGTDSRRPAPLILGHEAAGTVIGGEGIDDTWLGKRVTINPLVSCGNCAACKRGRTNICPERMIISMPPAEGAFAEQLAMRVENLVEVPEHVSSDHACLAEPLACGWHAVRMIEQSLDIPMKEAKCVVIGGGAIGLGSALCLRAFGVPSVIVSEPNELRHSAIQAAGFDVCKPADLQDQQDSFDAAIDAVGYPATRADASALVRPGAVIAHIGLGSPTDGLDIRRLTLQEITFFGTYTYTTEDFKDTAAAIFDGRMGDLNWIETRYLEAGAKAFADIDAGQSPAPKIVLHP